MRWVFFFKYFTQARLNTIYGETNLHRDERIVGEIQRLQTDKVSQSVSQMYYLLLIRPREAQRPDVTCYKSINLIIMNNMLFYLPLVIRFGASDS